MKRKDLKDKLGGSDDCYRHEMHHTDKGKTFTISFRNGNRNKEGYCLMKFDNCIYKSSVNPKCDIVFARFKFRHLYFIEISQQKSLEKAFNQVVAAIDYFRERGLATNRKEVFGVLPKKLKDRRVPQFDAAYLRYEKIFESKYGMKLSHADSLELT